MANNLITGHILNDISRRTVGHEEDIILAFLGKSFEQTVYIALVVTC